MKRVLLAHPEHLIVEGLRRLLENRGDVIGAVHDQPSLMRAALSLFPDVIVADIDLFHGAAGHLDALRKIRYSVPGVRVLCLADEHREAVARQARGAGLTGYVPKSSSTQEITAALNESLGIKARAADEPDSHCVEGLTARQARILRLVAHGMPSKDIAHTLKISLKTVEFHRASIKRRLGVSSTAEMTRRAVQHGL
jgi:DNA-binding NarL/FixJ family response regulator